MTVTDELERLAKLRDTGVLSEEEFQTQKTRVLGSEPIVTPPVASRRPSRIRLRNLVMAGLAVFVFLLIIASANGGAGKSVSTSNGPAEPPAEPVKALAVSAAQLARAYDDNEAAAQRDYGGRPLFVAGKVSGVDLDIVDNPVVQLDGTGMFQDVHANLTDSDKPKAADLHKGQSVDLLCQDVSEVIGSPILKDCAFEP